MENKMNNQFPKWAFMLVLVFYSISNLQLSVANEEEIYIVHVNTPENRTFVQSNDLESWYSSFLHFTTINSNQKQRMVYAYRNVVTGFAAKLTSEEAKALEMIDGVESAKPQRLLPLQTTHTPNFLGLHQNLGVWKGSNYGEGIIIGLLDTGITPGHLSFDDKGMPTPPAKWKGKCEVAGCNKKLIGARTFINGHGGSPLDKEGHGTHTSSTSGGNFVNGANVFGNANGTAVGMAPLAHLAMYKVCTEVGCGESDILAAMDAAVEEGVDVLSISISGGSLPFYMEPIAVGAFAAIRKGIFVSCSAGNDGPSSSTLGNEAPWILTVGASTIDRNIRATVKLGNADLFDGETLFQPKDFPETFLPLVYPGMNGDLDASECAQGSLGKIDVKGKVVVCERGGNMTRIAKGQTVKDAGGAAMVLINNELEGVTTFAEAHVLPASHVNYKDGLTILNYIKSTPSPVATILFRGTIIGVKSAPQVISFSSRGPSLASPGILKPDIIGPGVSILAAWPFSVDNNTKTAGTFNVISGTSMSCPHLSGIAALLKKEHPNWSPAAIKSAIMTTADLVNLEQKPIEDEKELPAGLFALGAGHVNPSKASNPGLVYDIQPNDYIPYLCGLGYSDKQVAAIVQKRVSCSKIKPIPEAQLNYPSFAITLATKASQKYTRTVSNVGDPDSLYTVDILSTKGVTISVSPPTLQFSAINQKLSYTVDIIRTDENQTIHFVEGAIIWNSAKHSVRSPISIKLA